MDKKHFSFQFYKNTWDMQNHVNYRRIKHMSRIIKLLEKVIDHRLRKETEVTENQF